MHVVIALPSCGVKHSEAAGFNLFRFPPHGDGRIGYTEPAAKHLILSCGTGGMRNVALYYRELCFSGMVFL
jgi:hypothetical protein